MSEKDFGLLIIVIIIALIGIVAMPVKADKPPQSTAYTNNIQNVVVGRRTDGEINRRSSVVKIVDGCRVLYIAGTYETIHGQLAVPTEIPSIAVSDIDCRK